MVIIGKRYAVRPGASLFNIAHIAIYCRGESGVPKSELQGRTCPLRGAYSICTNWPVPTDDCGVWRVWGACQKSIYDTW